MCIFMDRSRVKTAGSSEVETAIEKNFSEVAEGQPEALPYALSTTADGATFVAGLQLEEEEERDLFRRRVPT
jgi:hypothetical protein